MSAVKTNLEKLLTPDQVADLLGISRRHLSCLRASGKIKGHKLGHRTIRYYPAEIERYLVKRTG